MCMTVKVVATYTKEAMVALGHPLGHIHIHLCSSTVGKCGFEIEGRVLVHVDRWKPVDASLIAKE